MPAPLQDFGRVLGALFRFGRYLSFLLIGFMVVFLAFRVAELYRFFEGLQRWAGLAFLVVFFVLLWLLVGRPIVRFLRVPLVLTPPDLPPMAERRPADVAKHLRYLERYVASLRSNPSWEGDVGAIDAALADLRGLRGEAGGLRREDLPAFSARIRSFERGPVAALLAPLDRKARDVIRQEALAVGLSTAVSWNGTIDAFIVLWRNCNLASRIARIYYGRPAVRGTLSILRDVASATVASAYLGDLTEIGGEALGGAFGKTVGAIGGPLLEGTLNAVVTLRIGYLAKGRCRAFAAWSEHTRSEAVRSALKEASRLSKDVVGEIVRTVGGGILKLPSRLLAKAADSLSGLWKPREDGPAPAPAG